MIPEESDKFISKFIGTGKLEEMLAFKYLCKGFGIHEIEKKDRVIGWKFAEVKNFIPYPGKGDETEMFLDVWFYEYHPSENSNRKCHWEFRITVTGKGGTPDQPISLADLEAP